MDLHLHAVVAQAAAAENQRREGVKQQALFRATNHIKKEKFICLTFDR